MSQITEPRETGGPAFPHPGGASDSTVQESHLGMDLRDYFAAKAMAGWMASFGADSAHPASTGHTTTVAKFSYEMADAMLKARSA